MPNYIVNVQPLRHNDVDYEPGDVVNMPEVLAETTLAAGLLALAPDQSDATTKEVVTAQAKAEHKAAKLPELPVKHK